MAVISRCAAELTISLPAIIGNYRAIRRFTNSRPGIIAVVKANAYGHGLIEVARALAEEGADMLGVSNMDEAVALRDAGIAAPILSIGGCTECGARAAVEYNVAQAVFDIHTLDAMSREAARLNVRARAHLKIDTGMTRIGTKGAAALEALLKKWESVKNVEMAGIFTHFASAGTDAEFTEYQNGLFRAALQRVRAGGFSPTAHIAASAAIVSGAELWYDMIRPGVALYGATVTADMPGLTPAQRLATRPVRVEWAEPGETVGYGRTFTVQRRTRVMTLPIGYGDGYRRSLSNRAYVLVRGARAPIIGSVCMDQLTVDVTDIAGAQMGDEAVLLGSQMSERVTPDEMAEWADTIPYEIMLGFAPRQIKLTVQR
jgi:alanine racemase